MTMGVLFAGLGMAALSQQAAGAASGMALVLDGTEASMKNFEQAGNADWRVGPGEANGGSTIYADLGNGFLVTKDSLCRLPHPRRSLGGYARQQWHLHPLRGPG